MLDKIISAILNFFMVAIGLTIAWAVAETAGYFKPQPLSLRYAMAWGIGAVALAYSVWQWRRRKSPAIAAPVQLPAQAQPDRLAERMQALTARAKEKAAPIGPAENNKALNNPAAEAIEAANRQAIVFKQYFPPLLGSESLSFFGGAPIAPRNFSWPRSSDGTALSFIMQIDCSVVPEAGRLDCLPSTGVIYFFLDLEWAANKYKVVYCDRPTSDWRNVTAPSDLKPAFATETKYVWPWAPTEAEAPKLLPKWPFEPVLVDVPHLVQLDDEDGDTPFWSDNDTTAEILLEAQGGDIVKPELDVRNFLGPDGKLLRLYPTLPQDWRAVQIIAAAIRDHAERVKRYDEWKHQLPKTSKEEREAMVDSALEGAARWKAIADNQDGFAAVPQVQRDEFWSWLETHPLLSKSTLYQAVTDSIEWSLTTSPEAAGRIPEAIAERARIRHVLAVNYDDKIWANTPDRMLAAYSDVQGNQYETAQSNLLLFEMSSNRGLCHHFGEGVFQFWITPDDLKHRRFDRVTLTIDAY